jgi:hypothetical protein
LYDGLATEAPSHREIVQARPERASGRAATPFSEGV